MPFYRKKPVIVEAMRWDGNAWDSLNSFCANSWSRGDLIDQVGPDDKHLVVFNPLEKQWLNVPKGSWIIRGVEGELYPCDHEVFEATYEPAPPPRWEETASHRIYGSP